MPIRFLRLAIIWLLALATIWVMQPYVSALWFSASAPRTVTPRADLAASEQATVSLFKTVSPSVVHVFARGKPSTSMLSDEQESVVQSGSGIVQRQVVDRGHLPAGPAMKCYSAASRGGGSMRSTRVSTG